MSQKKRVSEALAYCFTINNPTDNDIETVKKVKCRGMKAAHEHINGEGTPHIQGAVCFKTKVSMKQAVKRLGGRASVRVMGGTWDQQDYCFKEGKEDQVIRNEGEGPKQGKRSDIVAFRDRIREGMTNLQAYEEHPDIMARWPRFYGGYRNALNQNVKRTWMTQGFWWHGKTGTGKSHKAHTEYPDAYVWNSDDKGWWDNYDGQETVIIDDFRGGLTYGTLLRLVDKYPYTVPQRGKEPVPFLAKRVIITSSLTPELVYNTLHETDSLDQLKRRFIITEFKTIE